MFLSIVSRDSYACKSNISFIIVLLQNEIHGCNIMFLAVEFWTIPIDTDEYLSHLDVSLILKHLLQFIIVAGYAHCPLGDHKCMLISSLRLTADSRLGTIFSLQKCRNPTGSYHLAHVLSCQRGLLSLSHTPTHPFHLKPVLNQSRPCCWWARAHCPCASSQVSNQFIVHETRLPSYAYLMPHHYIIRV